MKETTLARYVVLWLKSQGWEVYQEVQVDTYGCIADIVATQRNLIWTVECKTSFGLTVIKQAYRWRWRSHFTSIATPNTRNTHDEHGMGDLVLRQFGIGHLTVFARSDEWSVVETLAPKLHRKAYVEKLRAALVPERKIFAEAGNAEGKRWTPFQQTCMNVRDAVRRNPGLTIKELVDGISTHYHAPSTARSCLKKWIEEGKVKGVRLEKDGRVSRLYPDVAG